MCCIVLQPSLKFISHSFCERGDAPSCGKGRGWGEPVVGGVSQGMEQRARAGMAGSLPCRPQPPLPSPSHRTMSQLVGGQRPGNCGSATAAAAAARAHWHGILSAHALLSDDARRAAPRRRDGGSGAGAVGAEDVQAGAALLLGPEHGRVGAAGRRASR